MKLVSRIFFATQAQASNVSVKISNFGSVLEHVSALSKPSDFAFEPGKALVVANHDCITGFVAGGTCRGGADGYVI